ncbi:MAG: holo-ACP synthase [Planctomycetota bacterium]|nr:holo-ACP synthase [Planctomycetota bacterium]
MNVVAHGVDLVEVARIERMIDQHGDRFLDRVFTAGERSYADAAGPGRSERYAARFACKEAVFKVLGTGWGEGVSWSEVDVLKDARGCPSIKVHGVVSDKALSMGIQNWLVSITHTQGQAMASVIATGESC